MADNAKIAENASSTVYATTDEVTYSGDTTKLQVVRLVTAVTGSEGAKSITDAAVLADNTTNPTAALIGSLPHWFDGSTWDRAPGTAVDGALVNLGANNDVTIASGATSIAKAEDAASANADVGVPAMAVRKATPANTSDTDGDYEFLQMSAGRLWVDASGVSLTVNSHAVTNAGTFAVQVDGSALTALQLIDDPVFADDAGYTVGTSKLFAVGGVCVAHGSNPDAADANDAVAGLYNRHRVQFVIGGHPNTQVVTARRAAADSGVTDGAIVSVSTGSKIVVTRLTVTASNANTVNVAVKVGFGTSTLTADSTTGAANVIADHEGIPPGGGFTIGDGSGMIGVGADDADLRWTCDTPTGGHIIISASYYTIDS